MPYIADTDRAPRAAMGAGRLQLMCAGQLQWMCAGQLQRMGAGRHPAQTDPGAMTCDVCVGQMDDVAFFTHLQPRNNTCEIPDAK